MPIGWEKIEPLLLQVEKPARYVGGEFNQAVKPEARVRCCLAFPDLYELGMSYHGFRILYERINAREGWAAERAYAPWHDFEALLRLGGVPLYSLETRRTFAEFDWIGFTLQHESNLTNVLNMIDLAGLPVESKDRTAPLPILIGGGEGAYSPETLAPFLDAFVIGDGEEAVLELMALFERAKAEGWARGRILRELDALPGVYVPSLYEVEYHEDGRVKSIKRTDNEKPDYEHEHEHEHENQSAIRNPQSAIENAGETPALQNSAIRNPQSALEQSAIRNPQSAIEKRLFDIAGDLGPVRPVVPLLRTVHDRLVIEIRRGCVNGCRFCQAGMVNRPVHERPLEQIVEIARQGLLNTGYDEISLLSLSSADYTLIGPLIARLAEEFGPSGVSVTLPSLRINGFDIALVDQLAGQRRSGFTFAPEAGSERLRRVINKPVDQEHFLELVEDVFRRGWQTVKFYFMIGLPTETDEDLEGIVELCARAIHLGRRQQGKRAKINVTLSPFVPKAGTPFAWEAQPPRAELERRFDYVYDGVRARAGKGVEVKLANVSQSYLEAILARGDRRVAAVVRRAWELGARFDGWTDSFRPDLWQQAFDEAGLDPSFYANRPRAEDEVFPFELIESRVGRRFFWSDHQRALREATCQPCDQGPCAGCGVCGDAIRHTLAKEELRIADCGLQIKEETRNAECSAGVPPAYSNADSRLNEKSEISNLKSEINNPQSAIRNPQSKNPQSRIRGVAPNASPLPIQRLRLEFTKLEALRYLSHLDFAKVMAMILRRAEAPLAYTQGFNPMPRVQYAPPLSLGMGGEHELVDILLIRRLAPVALAKALGRIVPDGLRVLSLEEIPLKAPSLEATIRASIYNLQIGGDGLGLTAESIVEKLLGFAHRAEFVAEVAKKDRLVTVDLKRSIAEARFAPPLGLTLAIRHEVGLFVKPQQAAGHILGLPLELGRDLRINRIGFEMDND